MVDVQKDGIDLGIMVQDIDTALAFYKDTLGFVYDDMGTMDM